MKNKSSKSMILGATMLVVSMLGVFTVGKAEESSATIFSRFGRTVTSNTRVLLQAIRSRLVLAPGTPFRTATGGSDNGSKQNKKQSGANNDEDLNKSSTSNSGTDGQVNVDLGGSDLGQEGNLNVQGIRIDNLDLGGSDLGQEGNLNVQGIRIDNLDDNIGIIQSSYYPEGHKSAEIIRSKDGSIIESRYYGLDGFMKYRARLLPDGTIEVGAVDPEKGWVESKHPANQADIYLSGLGFDEHSGIMSSGYYPKGHKSVEIIRSEDGRIIENRYYGLDHRMKYRARRLSDGTVEVGAISSDYVTWVTSKHPANQADTYLKD